MIETTCAICGNNNSKQLYHANFNSGKVDKKLYSARRLPDKIHYRVVKCQDCGLVYSNPILSPERIEELYRKSTVTYDEHIGNLNKTYGHYFKKAADLVPNKQRLLEIGCGNGFFLQWAKERGWSKVWGVEPGEESVSQAPRWLRKKIIIDVFRPNQFKANFFDCVVIFQTLDHLIDPNEALIEVYKILKKKGVVLAIVHDVSSWSAKLMGERSPIIDIEHIYLFDKKTLAMIFEKNGFEVIQVFDIVNTHALEYWLYLSPLPLSAKKIMLKLISASGLGNIPLSLKAGNIGLIGRKV